MPCFHDVPRGMTGHASSPSRSGRTDCHTSTYGWPSDQHVRGVRPAAAGPRSTIRLSLVPGTRWSTSTPIRRPGPGREVADRAGEVVDAVEHLDDDALDPQVVAPDLLDELGVVLALDEDPRPARDPGPRPGRRRREPLAVREAAARRRPSAAPAGGGGRSERHRRAVDEEAGAEREALGAAAPVLEVHDVHAAGLLDPHDGAHPAGLDVLDDEAGLGRPASTERPAPAAPVTAEHVGAVAVRHGGEAYATSA